MDGRRAPHRARGRDTSEADDASPFLATEARYDVEVFVATHDRQAMLQREGRDPRVVRWNRTTEFLQRHANPWVHDRGRFGHGEDLKVRKMIPQPLLVPAAIPGPVGAIPKLPDHDDRDGDVRFDRQPGAYGRVAVDERRERVCIENHRRSSGSTTSNSLSMRR